MKNITLMVGALLAGAAFGQSALNVPSAKKKAPAFSTEKMSVKPGTIQKSPGDVIWSNSFSSMTNWMATNNPATPAANATHGWSIGTAHPWAFTTTVINSTSDGNYALAQNGDPRSTSTDLPWTNTQFFLLFDSTFNLSTYGDVLFNFQEFGARFIENQTVEASVDNGVSWIQIGTNADLPNYTAAGGSAYTNPTLRSYNVTNALNGQNLSAVRFRFKVEWPSGAGANDGVMYGWFVDDVALVEGSQNDLSLTQSVWPLTGDAGVYYSKFPRHQAGTATTTVTGFVDNVGSASQSVTLHATTTGYTGTDMATIAGFDTDSMAVTPAYTIPGVAGVNNIMVNVTAATTLDNTADDSRTYNFEVTNDIMAVDGFNGTTASASGYFVSFASQNQGEQTGIGTLMEVFKNDVIDGFQVGIGNVDATSQSDYLDQPVSVVLLDVSGDTPVLIAQSDDHNIAASDFGSLVDFTLSDPVSVTAGQQLIVLAISFVGANNVGGAPITFAGVIPHGATFGVNGSDFSADLVTLASDDATPDIVDAPVVRIKFQTPLGLKENITKNDVTVAPNPFTNETSVNFSLKADSDVSLIVTDMAGRQVVNIPAKHMSAGNNTLSIDGSQLQAGMYTYTLKAGNDVVTDRIVKR